MRPIDAACYDLLRLRAAAARCRLLLTAATSNVCDQLLHETNMTRTELFRLFNRFKALCQLSGTPGSINKQNFRDGVSSLAFEDDTFVNR